MWWSYQLLPRAKVLTVLRVLCGVVVAANVDRCVARTLRVSRLPVTTKAVSDLR